MSDKKKQQQFSPKRLRELEKQVEEYTDEDLLNEADELEKEMLAGNITYDLPDDFFQQILAKGKLIEAEKECNSQKPVGQDLEREAETKIKRVWDETVPPDAEPVTITVTTTLPPTEPPVRAGQTAGKPEVEAELPHVTRILTAESMPEEELARVDIAEADNVKAKPPIAAAESEVQKKEAAVEENSGQNGRRGVKKPRRKVKLRWKVLLTVMILVMVPLAFSITSGGKKHFLFETKKDYGVKGFKISLSNDGFTEYMVDSETSAYDTIEEQIGIDAIKIGDRPSDLFYVDYDIDGPRADVIFGCDDDKYLVLTQLKSNDKTKADYINDAEEEKVSSVYNEQLEINIEIYKEKVKSNKIKYHAVIITDTSIYNITATISLENFEIILKDLFF